MKIAVIGIGSNSVRMLVCEINGPEMRRLRREREGGICLGDLKKGEFRILSLEEVGKLL